jgi:hypothetical protein
MYEQVEKPKENKSRAVANSVAQKKSNVKQGFGFVDNRSATIAQRRLEEISNNCPHIVQKRGIEVGKTSIGNNITITKSGVGIDSQTAQRMMTVGETTLDTLEQVKNMMASDEHIGWDDRWAYLVQLFLAEGRSFDSPQELEAILEIYMEHELRTLIADSKSIKWDDRWDEAAEMIAKYPIYRFRSIPELIHLLNRLSGGLEQRQEPTDLMERPIPPHRKPIPSTWYIGMTKQGADDILKNGFKMRAGNPTSTASADNMARNGQGLYLSTSRNTAMSFAGDRGAICIFKITGLNLQSCTGIEHQMDGNGTTHLVQQGTILGSKTGNEGKDARNTIRKILIRQYLEGVGNVDYVYGITEGKGTWELVLVSQTAGDIIASKFTDKNCEVIE